MPTKKGVGLLELVKRTEREIFIWQRKLRLYRAAREYGKAAAACEMLKALSAFLASVDQRKESKR